MRQLPLFKRAEGENNKTKDALVGFVAFVFILAIGAGIYYSIGGDSIITPGSGELRRGGPYKELSKEHTRGSEFLGYINSAYDRLENDDPNDDAAAYLDLGFYKNELGDADGAIKAYLAGVEVFPTHEVMLSNLAHIYEDKKDYKNAEKYYKQLIGVNPQNVRARVDLGSMYRYYFDDRDEDIIRVIEVEGLAKNPNDQNLLIFLANYYRYDVGDLRKAEIYYRQILELNPLDAAVRVELRNLLEKQGRSL